MAEASSVDHRALIVAADVVGHSCLKTRLARLRAFGSTGISNSDRCQLVVEAPGEVGGGWRALQCGRRRRRQCRGVVGRLQFRKPEDLQRGTTPLRIAAGLEDRALRRHFGGDWPSQWTDAGSRSCWRTMACAISIEGAAAIGLPSAENMPIACTPSGRLTALM